MDQFEGTKTLHSSDNLSQRKTDAGWRPEIAAQRPKRSEPVKVLAVGLSYHTAPLEIRGKVSFNKESLEKALAHLRRRLGVGVILSTCNRTEVYTLCRDTSNGSRAVWDFLASFHNITADELYPYLYTLEHEEAVRHLFRVASGADSLVLGESQILGQVRDAFSAATSARTAKGSLSKLFQRAVRVGKRSRRETGIGRNALSVSYACVELARQSLGELRGATALLVGAGEAGKLACQALTKAGISRISIISRTYQRARDLADELGGVALPFNQLEEALSHANIVISATDSSRYVIDTRAMRQAIVSHKGNPLFLMDIAVPRDIDPEVAQIPGVRLFDIDDLKAVSHSNSLEREREAKKVDAIIDEEVFDFLHLWDSLSVESTIAALHRQAEDARQREVAKTLRLIPGLTDEQEQHIEGLSRALVKKLLHRPISVLRQQGNNEDAQAVQRLFDLDTMRLER